MRTSISFFFFFLIYLLNTHENVIRNYRELYRNFTSKQCHTMYITWHHTDLSNFFEALKTIRIIEISPWKNTWRWVDLSENIKNISDAPLKRHFGTARHANLARVISTPRPRRHYPKSSEIRFRSIETEKRFMTVSATRTKDFCPGEPRIFCLRCISISPTRRHQRPGGGVVGIDGPPPSRRNLSLSLSYSFYIYIKEIYVYIHIYLFCKMIVRTESLGHDIFPFSHSAIPRPTALTAIDGKHPAARGDYSARLFCTGGAHSHRERVLSLRAVRGCGRVHADDYTRTLALHRPLAHCSLTRFTQVCASERASVRGFTLVRAAAALARVHTSLRDLPPYIRQVRTKRSSVDTHLTDTHVHSRVALATPFSRTRSACSWQLDESRGRGTEVHVRAWRKRARVVVFFRMTIGDGNDDDEDRLTRDAACSPRPTRADEELLSLSSLSRAEKSGKIDRRPGAAPTETPLAAAAFSLPLSHRFACSLSLCLSFSLFLCRSVATTVTSPSSSRSSRDRSFVSLVRVIPSLLNQWPLSRLYLSLVFLSPSLLSISFSSTRLESTDT